MNLGIPDSTDRPLRARRPPGALRATLLCVAAAAGPWLFSEGRVERPGDVRFRATQRVEELRLPLASPPVSLTVWVPLPPSVGVSNLAELPVYREASRRTGVAVRFVHPQLGSSASDRGQADREMQELARMFASDAVPDMIAAQWRRFPGGPSRAVTEERIVPLNDLIALYMPSFRALLARHPEESRALRTDEGYVYGFPLLAWEAPRAAAAPASAAAADEAVPPDALGVRGGLQVRADLLEKLEIPLPRTVSDWDTALRKLKQDGGVETPLLLSLGRLAETGIFASAYGAAFGFFQMGGHVRYGPLEPGFRDFLALLAGWVKDGLVNADLGVVDASECERRVVAGRAAAWVDSYETMRRLGALLRRGQPGAAVAPAAPPSLEPDRLALLAPTDTWTGVIGDRWLALSAKSGHHALAAQWVDYWYSAEGRMLAHYGIEGVTYRLVEGKPELTAEGRSRRFNGGFHLVGIFDFAAWTARTQGLAEVARVWSLAATRDHALPPLQPSEAELALEERLLAQVSRLVEEATIAIVTGTRPLEHYEETVRALRALGVEDLVAAKQAQLERALRR